MGQRSWQFTPISIELRNFVECKLMNIANTYTYNLVESTLCQIAPIIQAQGEVTLAAPSVINFTMGTND